MRGVEQGGGSTSCGCKISISLGIPRSIYSADVGRGDTECVTNPTTSGHWTRNLWTRIMPVANILGTDATEYDASKFAGISFRKFALSELAKRVQPTILAAHGEHKSVETTNAYYVDISSRSEGSKGS